MGRKNRISKTKVFCAVEGEREEKFLGYLKEHYADESTMSFGVNYHNKGGNSDGILREALKNNNRDRVFAWFDEDIPLGEEILVALKKCWNSNDKDFLSCSARELQEKYNEKNRKPILIVSNPVCLEGLLLRILGRDPGEIFNPEIREAQIKKMKNTLDGVVGKDLIAYCREFLPKEKLEERRKEILELDLLIKMVSKPVSS